ncbi:Hypothetical predicted protein, partial [Pelobates cultripes]
DHLDRKLKCLESIDSNWYLLEWIILIGSSCHYKPWLDSVPKSQFLRLRRNCTQLENFEEQANTLKNKFMEKDYPEKALLENINEVKNKNRDELLKYKLKSKNDSISLPIIFNFNNKSKEIQKIIRKHWHILEHDEKLSKIIPEKPSVIFRGAPNFKSILTTNFTKETKSNNSVSFFPQSLGFYKCKNCNVCKTADPTMPPKITEFTSNKTKTTFKIKEFITCNTKNVIYLLQCPCGFQYVGMTTRCLKIRLGEHCRNIKNGYLNHSLSKHFLIHNKDPKMLKYMGIKKCSLPWRGGDIKNILGKIEMEWVYKLQTLTPNGLNADFDLM